MKRMVMMMAVTVYAAAAVAGPAAAWITFDLPNLTWPDDQTTLATKGKP